MYVTLMDESFNTDVCMSSGFGPSPTSYFWSGHAHILLSDSTGMQIKTTDRPVETIETIRMVHMIVG